MRYCSRAHQKKHWKKAHKVECAQFKKDAATSGVYSIDDHFKLCKSFHARLCAGRYKKAFKQAYQLLRFLYQPKSALILSKDTVENYAQMLAQAWQRFAICWIMEMGPKHATLMNHVKSCQWGDPSKWPDCPDELDLRTRIATSKAYACSERAAWIKRIAKLGDLPESNDPAAVFARFQQWLRNISMAKSYLCMAARGPQRAKYEALFATFDDTTTSNFVEKTVKDLGIQNDDNKSESWPLRRMKYNSTSSLLARCG